MIPLTPAQERIIQMLPATRAQIAKATGLSDRKMQDEISNLRRAGLVRVLQDRREWTYELTPDYE